MTFSAKCHGTPAQLTLTRRGQHLLPREYRIGASHETHGLLRLDQRQSASRQTYYRPRQYDTGGRDRPENGLVLHGLRYQRM